MSHASCLVAVDGPLNRIKELVAEQMEPFNENEGWFADGSRWDYWVIGGRSEHALAGKTIVRRAELSYDALRAYREGKARAWAEEAKGLDTTERALRFGFAENQTDDDYVAEYATPYFWAFLRNRQWHENERLGWFGGTAKSECELASKEEPVGKCLHEIERDGIRARVIGWRQDERAWKAAYWRRFIEPLPPETILVAVDYHV